eukprot:8296482-Lingulodinium_polyedra.AAC.1
MATPHGTTTHGQSLPIVVGQVVNTSSKRGVMVMAWRLPQLARVDLLRRSENNRLFMCSDLGHRWASFPT